MLILILHSFVYDHILTIHLWFLSMDFFDILYPLKPNIDFIQLYGIGKWVVAIIPIGVWFISQTPNNVSIKSKNLLLLAGSFLAIYAFVQAIYHLLFFDPTTIHFSHYLFILLLLVLSFCAIYFLLIPSAGSAASKKTQIKSQKQLKLFLKYSPGAVAMLDSDMKYLLVNQGWYETYDFTQTDIIGKSHYELFPEIKEMPKWLDDHKRALSGETLKKKEDCFTRNGKEMYLNWELRPWYAPNGEVGGIMMFTEDVTEEVLARRKLQESELLFSNIFDRSQFSIALVKDGGVPFLVNQNLCHLLGYSEAELTHMSFVEFTHPDDVEKDMTLYQKLLNYEIKSYTIDKRYITKTGKIKYVNLNVTLIDEGVEGSYALAMIEDITDRKRIDQQKSKMESMLSEVSVMAHIGAWEVDLQSKQVVWSDEIYHIHEEEPGLEVPLEKGIDYFKEPHLSRILEAIERAIEKKESYDLELILTTAKGNEKWVRTIGRPLVEGDQVVRLQGLFQDIDAKKRYELEMDAFNKNLEAEVSQRTNDLKQVNEELEAFSYSVSHDLRAPLRAIHGFSQALTEDFADKLPETATDYINRIAANSLKMGTLIDDLLAFSRMTRKRTAFTSVDLNHLVREIVDDQFYESKGIIKLDPLPTIVCDEHMISQVFSNLISNAIKYSSKVSAPAIAIVSKESVENFTIAIRDNGDGFNMEYYDKLFTVFQRLHRESEFSGTGVGLSLCKKIMDAHNGRIWAESEVGHGATFYLKFFKQSI